MAMVQSNEQTSMAQLSHGPNAIKIPREVFLSCAGAQARMTEIEQKTLGLLEDSILADPSGVEVVVSQLQLSTKGEFEFIARVIISKALDEPQHIKACVSLSGALTMLLPALPSPQGKKGETFMHALLDVFQTEFEEVFVDSSAQPCSHEDKIGARSISSNSAEQRNPNRIRAIVHFAGHLYCQRLLGNGVVSQMVQELVDNGQTEAANELLWFIGAVTNSERGNLGTVLEDGGDSDGASSEPLSLGERRPSCP